MAILKEFVREHSERNRTGALSNVHSVTNSRGFVPSIDYFNKEVFSSNLKNYKVVHKGMLAYNPSRINVGSVALLDSADTVIVSPLYVVVEVIKDCLLPEYLNAFLHSPTALSQIKVLTSGSVRDSLRYSSFELLQLPVPHIKQQRVVVLALDKVFNLIAKCDEQIVRLDKLVKSRFVEMFGDPMTNLMGWPMAKIGDHLEFLTSGSRGWAKYYSDDGELFITIKNVKGGKISVDDVQHVKPPTGAETERTRVHEGDLLISITADLGRTGVVSWKLADRGAYINQHLSCIRLDRKRVEPLFLAFYLESAAGKAQFEKKNQSAVKAGLNFEAIRSLRFYLPPLALQREFAAFVEKVDKLAFAARRRRDVARQLYRAKIQEFFG